MLRRLLATFSVLGALSVVAGAAADPVRYGIADDWPKWHPCGDIWWQSAKDIGYQDLRLTVQWDETQPTVIPDATNLQAAVDCAVVFDLRPILAIYPLHPDAIGPSAVAQARFASFVALVGTSFPTVQNFVVGNEPNVNRFWQPQYTATGRDAAATDYEHTLAASYDALKAARPDAVVWGPAISSRGNDDPYALTNPSHSPVWFIKYMGDAYRASRRTAPIFDEFDLHPYPPVQDTAAFTKTFPWPQVGAADLGRLKQALWDAFHGTAQPVPAEYAGGRTRDAGLPIDLDEAGEQTTLTGHDTAYAAAPENVLPIDEATQATRYVQLARIGACDPDVKTVLWFPLIDETDPASGFQSGQLYADLTPKLSYQALKTEIASSKGLCRRAVPGIARRWVHTTSVVGAVGVFGGSGATAGSHVPNKPAGITGLQTSATAAEDATYLASLVPVATGARGPTAARRVAVVSGTLRAYHRPPIKFLGRIPPGRYRIQIAMAAVTNPARRTTLTSNAFTVAAAAKR